MIFKMNRRSGIGWVSVRSTILNCLDWESIRIVWTDNWIEFYYFLIFFYNFFNWTNQTDRTNKPIIWSIRLLSSSKDIFRLFFYMHVTSRLPNQYSITFSQTLIYLLPPSLKLSWLTWRTEPGKCFWKFILEEEASSLLT